VSGKAPKSVLVISVESVFFQCSRAIVRSQLWNPDAHVARETLPSAGEMLAALSGNRVGGAEYDKALPKRGGETLY
jgi:predicted pyridoxine 5'-phosphate oxidase superfamily flavin-nucleotide-binding protein